jgi:hypothetical protein
MRETVKHLTLLISVSVPCSMSATAIFPGIRPGFLADVVVGAQLDAMTGVERKLFLRDRSDMAFYRPEPKPVDPPQVMTHTR